MISCAEFIAANAKKEKEMERYLGYCVFWFVSRSHRWHPFWYLSGKKCTFHHLLTENSAKNKDKIRREQLLLSFLPSIVVQISVYCLANQRDRIRIEERRTVLYCTGRINREESEESRTFSGGGFMNFERGLFLPCAVFMVCGITDNNTERGRGRERHFLPGFLIDNHRMPCLIKALYNTTAQ